MLFKGKAILKKLDIILKYVIQDPLKILHAQSAIYKELLTIKELLQDINGKLYIQNIKKGKK